MARFPLRCGTSNDIFTPADPRGPAEPEAARLCTPLHLGAGSPAAGFRVVADLAGGGESLVCLGATRAAALAQAPEALRGLEGRAWRLRLQRWVGSARQGRWQNVPCARKELPAVRGQRRQLPRGGGRPRNRSPLTSSAAPGTRRRPSRPPRR
jgi:hypothetical protein